MTTSIDRKMMRLSEKMRKLQETMNALEAQKKPKLTQTSDEIQQLAQQIKKLSATTGETVSEITALVAKAVGAKASTRRGPTGSVAPKYIDPVNPDNTWSGRGIAPLWLQRYEASGRSRTEFAV
jgi:DNA-binding protein H-NS